MDLITAIQNYIEDCRARFEYALAHNSYEIERCKQDYVAAQEMILTPQLFLEKQSRDYICSPI